MNRRGNDVDVLVHGGGMVGLVCGLAAARAGFTVAIVDAHAPEPWTGDGEPDQRVSALSRATERILEHLGVWEEILSRRAGPVEAIQAWDGLNEASIVFRAADSGEAHLAHIIENRLVQTALWDALQRHDGVRRYVPGTVEQLDTGTAGAEVRLDDGRRITASVVVGADGAGSAIRDLAGIEVSARDYGQLGVVCNVSTELPHRRVARQRFLPGGPVAFLPLADGRCSIVWSQPADEARERLALSDEAFLEALTAASGRFLGTVTGCGERAAFPLRRQHAAQYAAERVALVGDAAHVIHPLAGQGANLGFLDAAALVETLTIARDAGRDPGALPNLRRYERWRKGDNMLMQSAMDAFHGLFGRTDAAVVGLRGLGLSLADRVSPLKRQFMAHAMGERGDLPALARA